MAENVARPGKLARQNDQTERDNHCRRTGQHDQRKPDKHDRAADHAHDNPSNFRRVMQPNCRHDFLRQFHISLYGTEAVLQVCQTLSCRWTVEGGVRFPLQFRVALQLLRQVWRNVRND